MTAAWAPSALRGLPFSPSRASGGGDARAAAMLKLGFAEAGTAAVDGLVRAGLPPLPEAAQWPTMVLVLGASGGCGTPLTVSAAW